MADTGIRLRGVGTIERELYHASAELRAEFQSLVDQTAAAVANEARQQYGLVRRTGELAGSVVVEARKTSTGSTRYVRVLAPYSKSYEFGTGPRVTSKPLRTVGKMPAKPTLRRIANDRRDAFYRAAGQILKRALSRVAQ